MRTYTPISLDWQRKNGRPRPRMYPELYDVRWMERHATMPRSAVARLLGCDPRWVTTRRRQLKPEAPADDGRTARQRIRERYQQG